MNKQKLNNYKLTGSIHTLQIQAPWEVIVPPGLSGVDCRMKHDKQGNIYSSIKINPNSAQGDIWNYGECRQTVDDIIRSLNLQEYRLIRADMRLDSIQNDFFIQYWKVHRYLLSGLARAYNVRNKYLTKEMDTDKKISLSIKTTAFEVEFYDKIAESHGSDIVTARFEERTKTRGSANLDDIQAEFTRNWKIRWNEAIKNLYQVTEDYNCAMIPEWFDKVVENGLKENEFLAANADKFFTRDQMIRFLCAVGHHNPVVKADNFKSGYARKCDIEYFSDNDCRQIVKEIMRATGEFFSGQIGLKVTQNEAI